mgnify:FL=1
MLNKIVMLGNEGVGKKAIYSRFCGDGFYQNENQTKPGPGFRNNIYKTSNGESVALCLWYP